MDGSTFRSRLANLMQKSRRAMRLYEGVTGGHSDTGSFAVVQAREWRYAHGELLRGIAGALEHTLPREVMREVVSLRDTLGSQLLDSEKEIDRKSTQLQEASGCSDFIRAAILSAELVSLKARSQALHAAQHELELVLRIHKTGAAPDRGEDTSPLLARMPENVIPLRQRI